MNFKIIAVDFDGTLCENKYPDIGEANIELMKYLINERYNKGTKVVLWTCRAGRKLKEAIRWCKKQGLCFDAVNNNIREATKMFGKNTRKIFAHEYIDDRASKKFKLPYKSKGE